MNLLLWPSSGEVMAQMSVFQSRGSSRGRVQFTFWTVKCSCLAGELFRFGYEEKKMLQPSVSGVHVTVGVVFVFFIQFHPHPAPAGTNCLSRGAQTLTCT